jgi:uncharacterized protein YjaZ
MHFHILDTETTYHRLLAEKDAAARERRFIDELVTPFAGLTQMMGGGDGLAAFRMWQMSPEMFEGENGAYFAATLDTLAAANAWQKAAGALHQGWASFAPYAGRIPHKDITFGLMLADLRHAPGGEYGYSGFGAIPGWIMTVYSEANAYNLARLGGATVHELHHNLRFAVFPSNPMTMTVGEYMVAEGLAESFAGELFGEGVLGFYVTDFDDSRLDETRRIIGAALDLSGFAAVRGYIFGDDIAAQMGLPAAGVPPYAGYAIGYRVVQAYLKRCGKTVAEATFVPAAEIIAESGWFA